MRHVDDRLAATCAEASHPVGRQHVLLGEVEMCRLDRGRADGRYRDGGERHSTERSERIDRASPAGYGEEHARARGPTSGEEERGVQSDIGPTPRPRAAEAIEDLTRDETQPVAA